MLEWLEGTQFSALIRSELWGWPVALTIHALGTALVIGLILIIGLRLLGLFSLIPVRSLHHLFPVIWAAVAVQLLSGFTLWITKPTQYVADIAFLLKSLLFIAGVTLTYSFYGTLTREAGAWEDKGAVSPQAIRFVAATMLVWCGVLVTGRLTAYLGSI